MPSESELNSVRRAGAVILWRVRAEQPEQGGSNDSLGVWLGPCGLDIWDVSAALHSLLCGRSTDGGVRVECA